MDVAPQGGGCAVGRCLKERDFHSLSFAIDGGAQMKAYDGLGRIVGRHAVTPSDSHLTPTLVCTLGATCGPAAGTRPGPSSD